MMDEINEEYFKDKPYSFGGKYRLYDIYSRKDVDKALKANDTYTKFKRYKRSKTYSPIYVYQKRELFQSDVVFFTRNDLVAQNDGFKYLFTTIDVFTKMAWVYPMKDNKCETVLKCFKDILKKCGEKPQRLNTDRGSELICKKFKSFLKDNTIHHYLSYSLRKCPVVERFNLTIQRLLYKMMNQKNTLKWVTLLDSAMEIYLNRTHRTIKMTPLEAEKNENATRLRKIYFEKYSKAGGKKQKPKFKVGDTVRIFNERGQFHRGYMEDFSEEVFTISEIDTKLPVTRYKLKEYDGNEIIGSFFQNELISYTPSDFYKIDILDERGKGKKKEVLVSYRGYPSQYNEWKLLKDIKTL